MSVDPLRALQNAGTDAYAAALDGHRLIATGAYVDAEVPVLSLELTGQDPIDVAGIDDEGNFTFHLEVWAADDGRCVIVVNDTGDAPGELIDEADAIVDDVAAMLHQATGKDLRVRAMYLLEYEGQPMLIWSATS